MSTSAKLAVPLLLLVALAPGSCRARQHNYIDAWEDEELERSAQPSRYGSLWPLPQKVQISQVPFKLTGASFRIVDAKASSAGPSCALLQDAYRR